MDQPEEQKFQNPEAVLSDLDPTFKLQVEKLYRLRIYGRWLFVGLLWISVGASSLWGLRYPISLLQEHFTWAAVRYGLYFHPLSALGLSLCVGMTAGVLVGQSRNILIGLPNQEQRHLEQQVWRIRQQGPSHPLWKWICHTS